MGGFSAGALGLAIFAWMLRLAPLCFLIVLIAGCASTPNAADPPSGDPEVVHASASTLLSAADRELRELFDEIDQITEEFGTALYAVNRMLVRHPHCIDDWFERAAELDEGISVTLNDAERLRKRLRVQHDALSSLAVDLSKVTKLRNQVRLKRDIIAGLRPQLAYLLADTMNRNNPCPAVRRSAER